MSPSCPRSATLLAGLLFALGCGDGGSAPAIVPGASLAEVELGMRYDALVAQLGEPDSALVFNRQATLQYGERGLEVVMVSALDSEVSDDAYVLGVSAKEPGDYDGPQPGLARAEIEALLGAPDFEAAGIGFWDEGVSVTWEEDRAGQVAVFGAFAIEDAMPEMQPAAGGAR
ncbi:MAG TPA: hypothetical protein RMH85_30730 [Polyangiaceae bacterium LLY-WYZ-15_(1-7)]|nr:hypothetical protein [Myxococcales bacterium]MAT27134.1 hypothetical protein [Sandaracinus sp.]HJK89787.1 hypothetical protein [Polyangiaceae bacterium LLY-WYZ-15_(1-7)]MBJ72786.1 hypothetical protein [Sandaracinus sp.]HJL05752.1 hypothetical protein [Polyangiaceae bacterium LLY-WYZ-15_(1-7)]